MRFVMVTGMSGGGKSTAMRLLEDMGYYCVDNLPIQLIDKFVELLSTPNTEITKVAIGVDVRTDQPFARVEKTLSCLRQNGMVFEVLFMDASDAVLVKLYKESRRMHPLCSAENPRIEDGIEKERKILQQVKKDADYVIDTSKLLTRELKEELDRIFVKNEEYSSLMINILSFGFKHGIPADADLVFDVRFLPNPFYIDELKYLTGNDRGVQDYVMSFPEAGIFLDKLTDLLRFLIPNYIKEGKYQLVVAIGCTGGKHRSVTLANELYRKLRNREAKYGVSLSHRDI
ncbi:RNase adapter RapZ [Gallintestinimicrobium sp.]|uniref:RNase adapter RapZ n=1 Tax=Gallintestinimicrobium sp. TaxID=2981655 RepID=UPI003AF00C1B